MSYLDLTPADVGNLHRMIHEASEQFSSPGCIQFLIANTAENWDLYSRIQCYFGVKHYGERPADDRLVINHWVLLDYLFDALKQALQPHEEKFL